MNIRKKGNMWEISYWIPGYTKTFFERFDSEAEAQLRLAEIQWLKAQKKLAPPAPNQKTTTKTMSAFLDEYVEKYGMTHWGDSYLSLAKHRINDYIKPYIGFYLVKDITPNILDTYYAKLLKTKAVHLKGHKNTEKTVSYSVMDKCHCIIRSALSQAVRWGYIQSNPALYVSPPKAPKAVRSVWSPQNAQKALNTCQDSMLKICMELSLACSMRMGEILGLEWKNVYITKESITNNTSYLEVKQELKRCDRSAVEALVQTNRSDIFYVFPRMKEDTKTLLVLKAPKTRTSIRRIYIPNSIAAHLIELKVHQFFEKKSAHCLYHNYGLVIALPDGSPVETRIIDKKFKKLIKEQELPEVVFHSLRHLSTSLKLQYTGGDIKAVQGDTGHSQAAMVTQVYGHTFDENRKRIAGLMENEFFTAEDKKADNEAAEKENKIMEILKSSPELADLILALKSNNQ